MRQWNKVFLDGARGHPAEQIKGTAGLVVRARLAGPAKGLLPHHGPRALVIDIKVAGGLSKHLGGLGNHVPVLGKDGPGKSIGGSLGTSFQLQE